MILAIGFRVRSPRGTQFRRWATAALGEYLVKGFVMDDDRLKEPGTDYFEELLARIRDIRASEKQFYSKVLEIYRTSVDYDKDAEASRRFFQTVQNKMHHAAHGRTAAEVIVERADARQDHMGLTNRVTVAYLDFAELQAQGRRPMHMADWIAKLDDFLKLADRDVLQGAGRVSHAAAMATIDREYPVYEARRINAPSAVERHFAEAVGATRRIVAEKKARSKKGKRVLPEEPTDRVTTAQDFELADIATIYSGGTPSKAEPSFWNGSLPWLSAKDLKTFRVSDSIDRIAESAVGRGTRAVDAGATLVLVRGMQLFKSIPIALTTKRVTFNQDVKAIVGGPKVDPTFLAYALVARGSQLSVGVSAAGHGTGRLATETLETLPIWLPPLPEQRRIAAVLDAWDAAIGTAERLATTLERRWGSLVQRLLHQSEAKSVALGSIGRLEKGKGLPKGELSADGVACLRYAEIYTRYRDVTSTLESRTTEAAARTARELRTGDIVFAASGETAEEIGKAVAYVGQERAVVGGDTVVLTEHGQDAAYLAHVLNSPSLVRQKAAMGKGHSVVHIHAPDLAKLLVALPPLDTQRRIASALRDATDESRRVTALIDRLRHQKRGLMQQLLTGRLRVPESIDALLPSAPALPSPDLAAAA